MTELQIYFKQMELGPMANFVYLIGDPKTREAAVVDPAWEVDRILAQTEKDGFEIKNILITHGHPDHINGVEEMLNRTNAQLRMHRDEVPWIRGWEETAIKTSDGDQLKIGDIRLSFLHTPGHTEGSQCFLIHGPSGPESIVAGDTLFIDSCGRTDLPGGDPEVMVETITQKLLKLDDDMILYPGHNYSQEKSARMGDQKKTNPYLQAENLKHFVRRTTPEIL